MTANLKKFCVSAMLLAIGLVLPGITMRIPEIGNMLCPMHIPVLLCGIICGWKYGLAVGAITPILRSFIFAMPPLYPNAIGMAFELAAYGCSIALIFSLFKKKNIAAIYASLISAMIIGRLVWGVARTVMLGVAGTGFSFEIFITSGFVEAVPGIIVQLILIPVLVSALLRAKLLPIK